MTLVYYKIELYSMASDTWVLFHQAIFSGSSQIIIKEMLIYTTKLGQRCVLINDFI